MYGLSQIALAVTIVAATTAGAQGLVEKPSLAVGDRWNYRVIDMRKGEEVSTYLSQVSAVSGDNIELQRTTLSSANQQAVGQKTTDKVDITTWTFANPGLIEGRSVVIAFPIELGKTWQYEFKVKGANGDTSQVRKAKAESWEEVRVPAGTFKAFKIVHEGTWERTEIGRSYSGVVTETIWYSPEAKRVIKRAFRDRAPGGGVWDDSVTELVSFEVKP